MVSLCSISLMSRVRLTSSALMAASCLVMASSSALMLAACSLMVASTSLILDFLDFSLQCLDIPLVGEVFITAGLTPGDDFGLGLRHADASQALNEVVGVEGDGFSFHGMQGNGWGGGIASWCGGASVNP